MIENSKPMNSIWVTGDTPGEMNCGKAAKKNTMVFALVMPTTIDSKIMRLVLGGFSITAVSSLALRFKTALRPR